MRCAETRSNLDHRRDEELRRLISMKWWRPNIDAVPRIMTTSTISQTSTVSTWTWAEHQSSMQCQKRGRPLHWTIVRRSLWLCTNSAERRCIKIKMMEANLNKLLLMRKKARAVASARTRVALGNQKVKSRYATSTPLLMSASSSFSSALSYCCRLQLSGLLLLICRACMKPSWTSTSCSSAWCSLFNNWVWNLSSATSASWTTIGASVCSRCSLRSLRVPTVRIRSYSTFVRHYSFCSLGSTVCLPGLTGPQTLRGPSSMNLTIKNRWSRRNWRMIWQSTTLNKCAKKGQELKRLTKALWKQASSWANFLEMVLKVPAITIMLTREAFTEWNSIVIRKIRSGRVAMKTATYKSGSQGCLSPQFVIKKKM